MSKECIQFFGPLCIKVPEQGGRHELTPTAANISFQVLHYTVRLHLKSLVITKRYWDKYNDCDIVRKHQLVVTCKDFLIQKKGTTNKREILVTKL